MKSYNFKVTFWGVPEQGDVSIPVIIDENNEETAIEKAKKLTGIEKYRDISAELLPKNVDLFDCCR